ncbi:MAG: hypothetical protein IJ222_06890 [Bacteroidales bacterium]|nr:hypothetical protein [Bacteroidales bacterium]
MMFAAVAAVASVSCSKEIAPAEEPGNIDVTITAGAATKTAIKDGTANTIVWKDGDALGVTNGSATVKFDETDVADEAVSATFSGTVAATGNYYAFYPYSAAGASEVTLPATQNISSVYSFDGAADLLVSKQFSVAETAATVNDLEFKRLVGFVKIVAKDGTTENTLASKTFKSVTLTAANDLVGKVSIDLAGQKLGASVSEGSKTVVANLPAETYSITSEGGVIFSVLPQTFAAGSTLVISAETTGLAYTKTITLPNAVTLKESQILPINVTFTDADITSKITIGSTGYPTIQAAVEAAKAGDVVKVAAGVYDEHILIDGKAITIQGAGETTVINSVELFKAAATVKDLTIKVVSYVNPVTETDLAANLNGNSFGIFIRRSGYGATFDNVTIDMTDAHANATGIFTYGTKEERTDAYDVFQNGTINGVADKRNAQLYNAKLKLLNNTIISGHHDYGIRFCFSDDASATDAVVENNVFKSAGGTSTAAIQLLNKFSGSKFSFSGNTQDGSFKWLITAANYWLKENNSVSGVILGRGSATANQSEYVQKAEGLATRAWGYFNSEGDWDNDMVTTRNEWNRSAVITSDYIYIPVAGNADGQYGVAVFNRRTGAFVETITSGFNTGSDQTFRTCGIARLGSKIFVSNLARNGQTLRIYELNTESKSATEVLSYVTKGTRDNADQNLRLGDKMSAWGDLTKGVLGFTDYDGKGYVEFRIKDNVWDTEAKTSTGEFQRKVALSQIGGIYWTDGNVSTAVDGGGERHGIYASNREVNFRVTYCYGQVDYLYGGTGYWLSTEQGLESNMMDPRWFWYSDGNKYLAYVSSTGTIGGKASGYLKIVKMVGDTWLAQLQGIPTQSVVGVYPLGSATDVNATGNVNSNQQGFCDIYNDGEGGVWIAAGLSECGISLFQMN